MTDKARQMVLCFTLVIRSLIQVCLIDHKYGIKPEENQALYFNFKSIVSVFYWTVIRYFRSEVKVVRDLASKSVSSNRDESVLTKKVLCVSEPQLSIEDSSYKQALIMYIERNSKLDYNAENDLLKSVLKKIPSFSPDSLVDDVEHLLQFCYTEKETELFIKIAKAKNFYLDKLILKWIKDLIQKFPEVDLIGERF